MTQKTTEQYWAVCFYDERPIEFYDTLDEALSASAREVDSGNVQPFIQSRTRK